MTYTIAHNPQFNSIEISFDGKPSEAIRDALKALKFRWHSVKKVWYGYSTEEAVRAAIDGKPMEDKPEKEQAAPKVDREALRAEFAKAWSSPKMIDYCTNKVAAVAVLPSGEIVTVDKQKIETSFCFGESGYDYDEAAEMAQHARESSEYFKRENMKEFESWINDLTEVLNGLSNYRLTISDKAYFGQSDDCKLRNISFDKLSDIIDAFGGSADLYELPGKELSVNGRSCRVATPKEIEIILDAYKAAAKAHEKKVDSYLKRYGTSKVHSWTYWRDA